MVRHDRRTNYVRAVARQAAEHGWRPFPGFQTTKVPALRGWSGLNHYDWDAADLVAAISDYQPTDNYACCLAAQPEIVALDADIVDPEQAAYANALADDILGVTPLVRIGLAPKAIRIYRASDLIRSRNYTRLKSSQVPVNSLPSAGTQKPAVLIFGRKLLPSPSTQTVTRSQR
jgi:hypothetical protein